MANNNTLDLKINIDTKLRGVLALIRALEKLGDAVNVRAEFEKLQTTLNSVSLSSREADKSFEWVKDFAKNTPVSLQDVTRNFIKLKAYGIDPVNGTLKTLTDTSSAMGKDLGQRVEALADAVTGENERLKEFGIKRKAVGDDFKYTFTSKSGETKDIVVKNNKEMIESTLLAIFNEKYAGRAEAQSKTLQGINNNLKDNFEQLQVSLVNNLGIYDITKESLKNIADGVSTFNVSQEKSLEISYNIINAYTNITKTLNYMSLGFSSMGESGVYVFKSLENELESLKLSFDLIADGSNLLWSEMKLSIGETIGFVQKLEIAYEKQFGNKEEALLKEKKLEDNISILKDERDKRSVKSRENVFKFSDEQKKVREEINKKEIENSKILFDNIKKKIDLTNQDLRKNDAVNTKLKAQSELRINNENKINEELKKQVENDKTRNNLKEKLLLKDITEIEYKKQLSELTKKEQNDYQNYINEQFKRYNFKVQNNLLTREQQKQELSNLNTLASKYDEIGVIKAKQKQKESVDTEEIKKKEKEIEKINKEKINDFQDLIADRVKYNEEIANEITLVKRTQKSEMEVLKAKQKLEMDETLKFQDEINKAKNDKLFKNSKDIITAEKVLNDERLLLEKKHQEEVKTLKLQQDEEYRKQKKQMDSDKKYIYKDLGIDNPDAKAVDNLDAFTTALAPDASAKYEEDLDLLKSFHEEELKLEQEHNASLAEIDELKIKQKKARDDLYYKYQIQASLEFGSKLANGAQALADLGIISRKKAGRAKQAVAIAEATVNTFTRASAALASGGPWLGPILAGIQVATGLAQVRQIRRQKFHTGGYISADMSSSSNGLRNDEVQATLQTGEGVLSRRGMKELENLNGGKSENLNNGGGTGEVNVVIVDNRQSREDYLKSRNGKKVIKEINQG